MELVIRSLHTRDRDALLGMWCALWPPDPGDDHAPDVDARIAGRPATTLPLQTFVAESRALGVIGFVEVGLRSHADGCDPSRAVAFVEGWYVAPQARRAGIGRALVERAEAWGRRHGATEIASDTWLDRQSSIDAHQALGFEVVDRCVRFRKPL